MDMIIKKTSAGFLIKSKGLFLICHSTQDPDYIYSDSDSFWTIPKGIVEEGESCLTTALRETEEETGLNLLSFYPVTKFNKVFHKYNSNSKKYVVYFLDDIDNKISDQPLICNSRIVNERYSLRNGLPEHDMFKWATKEEAKTLVFLSMQHLFELV